MFERIRQAFLDDSVDGEVLYRGETLQPGRVQLDRHPAALQAFGQGRQFRGSGCGTLQFRAETLHEPPGFLQCAPCRRRNDVGRLLHQFRLSPVDVADAFRLGCDDGEGMRKDVMQLPGDPVALLFDHQGARR
ncbi:hypothetical protein PJL18_03654 [Paenarthrobacter nicotinovorans]|nr:hypothetical protein [Paenarthrobacter nicotinovorans]